MMTTAPSTATDPTPTIHFEKDWRHFFDSLQYGATRLSRLKTACLLPDVIFIESQYNPYHTPDESHSPLAWFTQQKTAKGEGIFKVKPSQTTPQAILARLDRHLVGALGETVAPVSDRIAAVAMFHDRSSLLTFGQVETLLYEMTNTMFSRDGEEEEEEEKEEEEGERRAEKRAERMAEGAMLCRPDHVPFCLYFVVPPGVDGKRYVSTSMSSKREGTLLGQQSGTTMSNDWYERRGVLDGRPPAEWSLHGSATTVGVSDNEARRSVDGGMRQLCRCLALPRYDVDERISVRGAILEFMFDRDQMLWWCGIVSLTTMIDKPIRTPRASVGGSRSSVVSLPEDSIAMLDSNSKNILMTTPSSTTTTHAPRLHTSPHTSLHTSLHTSVHSPQHSPLMHPTRPGTAPSTARRFTPAGRPAPSTKRIGGGHTYQMSVESMTSTRYTGIGGGNGRGSGGGNGLGSGERKKKRPMSGKMASRSILLAHGARHCDPPALVAMVSFYLLFYLLFFFFRRSILFATNLLVEPL